MTTSQAEAINKKYVSLEEEVKKLKYRIDKQNDTIKSQSIIIKSQIDTIYKKEIEIKFKIDTIQKYSDKVVYVENDKTSQLNKLKIDYDSLEESNKALKDTIWKWAICPTLIFTDFPNDTSVYLLDLSRYYMYEKDFSIYFEPMTNRQYMKFNAFVNTYGVSNSAWWKFRNNYKIKRYIPDKNSKYLRKTLKLKYD